MKNNIQKLVLASKNAGKIRELKELLIDLPIEVVSAFEMGFQDDIEETGTTFACNAILKAETISKTLNCWSLADDSGIVVEYLGGEPGVYSARYAGEYVSDVANNAKLLARMHSVPLQQRRASFVSVIALARPYEETLTFEGICNGQLLYVPRGQAGFGYDPIFLPDDHDLSYAELSDAQKNQISHRGIAMRLLNAFLNKELQS